MIAAAIAASSARRWYWLYLRLLGSRNGIRSNKGGAHLILCLALLGIV